jgi:hypothetical protein
VFRLKLTDVVAQLRYDQLDARDLLLLMVGYELETFSDGYQPVGIRARYIARHFIQSEDTPLHEVAAMDYHELCHRCPPERVNNLDVVRDQLKKLERMSESAKAKRASAGYAARLTRHTVMEAEYGQGRDIALTVRQTIIEATLRCERSTPRSPDVDECLGLALRNIDLVLEYIEDKIGEVPISRSGYDYVAAEMAKLEEHIERMEQMALVNERRHAAGQIVLGHLFPGEDSVTTPA